MRALLAEPHSDRVRRFLAYGVLGLGVEVVFTSVARVLNTRNPRLEGRTYLWMLPIYGAGGLLLERLHARLLGRRVPPPVRALAATGAIYSIEYGAGSLLRALLGECPWKYERGLTLGGYVRLDYAPFWFGTALLFELLQREVHKLDRSRRVRLDRRTRAREPDRARMATGRGEDAGAAARRPPAEERRREPRRGDDRRAAGRAVLRRGRDVPSAAEPAPGATASA